MSVDFSVQTTDQASAAALSSALTAAASASGGSALVAALQAGGLTAVTSLSVAVAPTVVSSSAPLPPPAPSPVSLVVASVAQVMGSTSNTSAAAILEVVANVTVVLNNATALVQSDDDVVRPRHPRQTRATASTLLLIRYSSVSCR